LFMLVFSTLGSLRLPKVEASLVHSETVSKHKSQNKENNYGFVM
jgi:hypothetical protein